MDVDPSSVVANDGGSVMDKDWQIESIGVAIDRQEDRIVDRDGQIGSIVDKHSILTLKRVKMQDRQMGSDYGITSIRCS